MLERKGIRVKEERAPEKLKNNGEKGDERLQNHLLHVNSSSTLATISISKH